MNVCKTKDYSKAEEFVDQFMLEAYATSQVSFIYYINYLLTSSVRHLSSAQYHSPIASKSDCLIKMIRIVKIKKLK